MIFGLFRKRSARLESVNALFGRVAEASRLPALYGDGAIPDSFEGRFESLTLHVFLVLRRLRALPAPAGELAQDLVDACFAYLELGFRHGGISDVAVPKRMKKVAQSFYGRVQAYETALDSGDEAALIAALRRNTGAQQHAPALARYVLQAQTALAGQELGGLTGGAPLFPHFATREHGHGG